MMTSIGVTSMERSEADAGEAGIGGGGSRKQERAPRDATQGAWLRKRTMGFEPTTLSLGS